MGESAQTVQIGNWEFMSLQKQYVTPPHRCIFLCFIVGKCLWTFLVCRKNCDMIKWLFPFPLLLMNFQQHLLFQQDGTPNSRKCGVDMRDQLLGDCNCQTELFSLGFPYRLYTHQPPMSATLQENYNKSPVLAVQLVDGNAQNSVDRTSVVALSTHAVHSEHV